jgi:hypothetical protein
MEGSGLQEEGAILNGRSFLFGGLRGFPLNTTSIDIRTFCQSYLHVPSGPSACNVHLINIHGCIRKIPPMRACRRKSPRHPLKSQWENSSRLE